MKHVGMKEEKSKALTKAEILVMLKEKGIECDDKMTKEELLVLLSQ